MESRDIGWVHLTRDGCKLFVYDHRPPNGYRATIHYVAGIAGINHRAESAVIAALSRGKNRIVVVHPRGTGLSEGVRGDVESIGVLVDDLVEVITQDEDQDSVRRPLFLFGHSMAMALGLAAAARLEGLAGVIMVNPPHLQKKAKGMSPTFGQYLRYAWYYVVARHRPIVDMAGDPSLIENDEDRSDAEQRRNDPLLVRYFSLHTMMQVRALLRAMPNRCRRAQWPLLLLYGDADPLVDKPGCDLIYDHWKHPDKEYRVIGNGGHGRSTVLRSMGIVGEWIERHCPVGS